MTSRSPTEQQMRLLLREARRYLAVVETFRIEGCSPSWRPELPQARKTRWRDMPQSARLDPG